MIMNKNTENKMKIEKIHIIKSIRSHTSHKNAFVLLTNKKALRFKNSNANRSPLNINSLTH